MIHSTCLLANISKNTSRSAGITKNSLTSQFSRDFPCSMASSTSGGSRNFHKRGPTGCLRRGPLPSNFSDSLYNQKAPWAHPPKSASEYSK